MDVELKRALAFAILMQGGQGYEGKSPKYMLEKWEVIKQHDEPEFLLDSVNQVRFYAWCIAWKQEG